MIAVVFPGQGSQAPGMGKALFEAFPEAQTTFKRVGDATGIDAARLCFEADADVLRQTENAQLSLFATSMAAFHVLHARLSDIGRSRLVATAGHSVGEYAALAASGIYSLEDGARLVAARGKVMAEAGKSAPGTMAAVLGLGRSELEAACVEAGGVVVVANDNCPGQLVISGGVEAVLSASELARGRGAKRVLPLNVSGAFHSPLMEVPAIEMAKALTQFALGSSTLKVYSNVTSEPISNVDHWPQLLERQLKSPVRWTESVEHMRRDGVKLFIECGSGEVLSGMIRRIDKESLVARVSDPASLDATLQMVHELVGEE